MVKRISHLFCTLISVLLLSGCWDMVNIEERGFIVAMAVDLAEENESAKGHHRLLLTSQIAVPPNLGTPSNSGAGGKGYMNLSASGESMYAIAQDIANQTNKIPFFEHVKLVVISEEVAAIPELFANVMDVLIRNRDTRRGIKVLIAKGKAKDILNIEPENEKLPTRYINKILDNSLTKTGEIRPVRVGDIHEYLLTGSSFVLAKISSGDKKLNFEGGSVYNGHAKKTTGSLNMDEMLGFDLIIGENVRGPIVFDFNDQLTVYSIRGANSKIKINDQNPQNLDITITIKLEGEIQETFGTVLLKEKGVIKGLERAITKKVEEITKKTIHKSQKDLETDIFGMENKLKKFHYDTWKELHNNWDHGENYFSKSNIHVNVTVKVRTDGVVDISKDKKVK
ncbi:Ger(x)C family spore germination protein [Lederbergia graminis]|uniref:Ger(X)C family spore germination protein n=1 Tax=Lederbergia graminis TaxID=735518 RepID=A0ABW0LIA2_9BACI